MNRKLGTKTEIKSFHSAAGCFASSHLLNGDSCKAWKHLEPFQHFHVPPPDSRLLTINRLVNDVWRGHNSSYVFILGTWYYACPEVVSIAKNIFEKAKGRWASLYFNWQSEKALAAAFSNAMYSSGFQVWKWRVEASSICLTGLTRSVSACPFSETVTNGNWRDLILSPAPLCTGLGLIRAFSELIGCC